MNPSIIYREYKPALTKVCGKLVKDPRDVQELVHDSFIKIFDKFETFDPKKASLYTWMRKIAINTSVDRIRKEQVRWLELPDEEISIMPSVEIYFMDRNLFNFIPTASLKVFNLYTEGYSHKEIGCILGISEGTSKWHLSEARRILRKSINR